MTYELLHFGTNQEKASQCSKEEEVGYRNWNKVMFDYSESSVESY